MTGVGILRDWLLPPTQDPATRCAGLLVDRLDLAPPVDVEAVARLHGDIEILLWPFACEALVVGLSSLDTDRPVVYIRGNNQGRRRRRFTIAHETGHLVLPWHVGLTACAPLDEPYTGDVMGPASAGDLLSPLRVAEQEAEATRFAAGLLIPRRFIEATAERHDLGEVVTALNETDASAQASVLTLARNLLPGFCFLIDEDETGDQHVIPSSGTSTPRRSSRPLEAQLRDKAYDYGETNVSGRRVVWFRLASQRPFVLPDDSRTTSGILRDALSHSRLAPEEMQRMFQRINGIAAGMLSRGERAQTEAQALAVLEHRFTDEDEFAELSEVTDFRLYLRRKASERVHGQE